MPGIWYHADRHELKQSGGCQFIFYLWYAELCPRGAGVAGGKKLPVPKKGEKYPTSTPTNRPTHTQPCTTNNSTAVRSAAIIHN